MTTQSVFYTVPKEEFEEMKQVISDLSEYLKKAKFQRNKKLTKNSEIGAYCGIAPNTVSDYKRQGRIPGYYEKGAGRNQREVFVCWTDELDEWIKRGKSSRAATEINTKRAKTL